MDQIKDDDLGLLVWCAMSYDRRLPFGSVPEDIWWALTPEWREKINRWKGNRDHLGAEVRRGLLVPGRVVRRRR